MFLADLFYYSVEKVLYNDKKIQSANEKML
jgi:hypothetical protein